MFAFIAAVLQATSTIIDKAFFNASHKGYQTYVAISFPLVALFSGFAFFWFDIPFHFGTFVEVSGVLFLVSVLITFGGNMFYYRAMAVDAVYEVQLIGLLHNFPVIILSSLLFTGERHMTTIIAATIAVLAVIWSHIDSSQIRLEPKTKQFLLYEMAVSPFGVVAAKVLLETIHPIAFEFLRTFALAILVAPLFISYIAPVSTKGVLLLISTNIITTIAWILYFYSIQQLGILSSVLIFSIQPLLVYMGSALLLKERFEWKKAVALVVVICAISINELFR
ncbi:MAG: EamA family transporter [Patescibacteria group bacterium]